MNEGKSHWDKPRHGGQAVDYQSQLTHTGRCTVQRDDYPDPELLNPGDELSIPNAAVEEFNHGTGTKLTKWIEQLIPIFEFKWYYDEAKRTWMLAIGERKAASATSEADVPSECVEESDGLPEIPEGFMDAAAAAKSFEEFERLYIGSPASDPEAMFNKCHRLKGYAEKSEGLEKYNPPRLDPPRDVEYHGVKTGHFDGVVKGDVVAKFKEEYLLEPLDLDKLGVMPEIRAMFEKMRQDIAARLEERIETRIAEQFKLPLDEPAPTEDDAETVGIMQLPKS